MLFYENWIVIEAVVGVGVIDSPTVDMMIVDLVGVHYVLYNI